MFEFAVDAFTNRDFREVTRSPQKEMPIRLHQSASSLTTLANSTPTQLQGARHVGADVFVMFVYVVACVVANQIFQELNKNKIQERSYKSRIKT